MLKLLPGLLLCTIALHSAMIAVCQTPTDLYSPDKKIMIRFETGSEDKKTETANQLYYSVSLNGKWLLKQSVLSLDIKGYAPLGAAVRITDTKTSSTDETYHLLSGKASDVRNQYNFVQLQLEETTDQSKSV